AARFPGAVPRREGRARGAKLQAVRLNSGGAFRVGRTPGRAYRVAHDAQRWGAATERTDLVPTGHEVVATEARRTGALQPRCGKRLRGTLPQVVTEARSAGALQPREAKCLWALCYFGINAVARARRAQKEAGGTPWTGTPATANWAQGHEPGGVGRTGRGGGK